MAKLERIRTEVESLAPALRDAYAQRPDGKFELLLSDEPPAEPKQPNGGGNAVDLSTDTARAKVRRGELRELFGQHQRAGLVRPLRLDVPPLLVIEVAVETARGQ